MLVMGLKFQLVLLGMVQLQKLTDVSYIVLVALLENGAIMIVLAHITLFVNMIFNPIHHIIFFLPLVTSWAGHHPPCIKNNEFLYF